MPGAGYGIATAIGPTPRILALYYYPGANVLTRLSESAFPHNGLLIRNGGVQAFSWAHNTGNA
jgi:hypothetical protein